MSRWIRSSVPVVMAVLLAAPAFAQGGPPGRRGQERMQHRDEAFKMVDAYFISNMQESLGLTDAQFVTLLPLVKGYRDAQRDLAQRRIRALVGLKRTLESGAATEASVAAGLKDLKAIEVEESTSLRAQREAIDGKLSAIQQAQYRVLESEVERKIRMLMNQARQGNRRRGGPGPDDLTP